VQEVKILLRFTVPCLGADKRIRNGLGTVFCFPRTPGGQVLFHQTWWRAIVTHAARIKNIPTTVIKKIEWSPIVDGSPRLWQRYIHDPTRLEGTRPKYAQHEAFLPGRVIGVECILPVDLAVGTFAALMDVAGKFRGISPYKPGEYGRFTVVSVQPAGRVIPQSDVLQNSEPAGGPSDGLT
jgi:hypothetical protein